MPGQKLVIVESPAKARTIGKMLGDDYAIRASMGHVRDLPEHSFGVDIEHDFAPAYEVSSKRSKTLTELKTLAKTASEIYLAPDPDREGEAIAWHLKEVLSKGSKAPFHRVSFHEITKTAINKAFQTPGEIDMPRVDAQQARRVLDRLVGYMISPLLWSKIERGISAGRVQSVALRIVCEREREIQKFVPKEYWNFLGLFEAQAPGSGKTFEAKLSKIDGAKFEIGNGADAEAIMKGVKSVKNYKVANVETAPRRRYAPPPFITSTMQQAASSYLGFSANGTMRAAQQLYEGVDVGNGGPTGLITYMRTDSVTVAVEAQNAAREFISSTYGKDYIPAKPNFFKSKDSAQGAHEAIRPTDVRLTPDQLKGSLEPQLFKLYTLIWRRFVASQMAPAEQMKTAVDVEAPGVDGHLYSFRSVATVTTFPGFLRAYDIVEEGAASSEDDEAKPSEVLGLLKKGDGSFLKDSRSEQKFTEPPARFSEATLIKELEANGIGRPSTYATIVNTIQERKYVAKDKGKLIPSELGFKVNDYLVATLPELFQIGFTADMETKLDSIEEGKVQWTGMLKDFYSKFSVWLEAAKGVGAPEKGKADALLEVLKSVTTWDAPEKGARKTYDDKKFFKSIVDKYEKSPKLSSRQWEALLGLAVKYSSQIPNLKESAKSNAFDSDLETAIEKHVERAAKIEEIKARREESAASAPPKGELDAAFSSMSAVKWSAPEKRRGRVYDDKKFFESLKKQHDSGKPLSEKQIAALGKMASRYKEQIPDYDAAIAKVLTQAPAVPASPESIAAAASASQEVDSLLKDLSAVEKWGEPVKRGRRVYDDKEFFESLSKQRAAGRTLSDRQVAALKKLAGKYAK